jgi:broad specificity phosphatase PhoE
MKRLSKTLYLFRHGLATHSAEGYGDEILTAHVLPEGKPPVKKLAQYLKTVPLDLQISSEIPRCKETAAIVSEVTGKKFNYDRRLNEYYLETFEDFGLRVKSFLNDLNKQNYQYAAICTHGAVIAAIKNFLLKNNFEVEDQLDYPLTGELWILKENKIKKVNFN